MPETKINARDWTFEISDGEETPELIEIAGINTMALGRSSQERETTDFDSHGERESMPMERHRTIRIEGDVIEDDGDLEPGQARLEELAALVGAAGLAEFVFTSPGGRTFTQKAWVDPGEQGGGNNDGTSFSYTLVRSGPTVKGSAS